MSKPLREEKDLLRQHPAKEGERVRAPGPERSDEPLLVDEICVEELAIDGICGVY